MMYDKFHGKLPAYLLDSNLEASGETRHQQIAPIWRVPAIEEASQGSRQSADGVGFCEIARISSHQPKWSYCLHFKSHVTAKRRQAG
jgi:hypothetical protein